MYAYLAAAAAFLTMNANPSSTPREYAFDLWDWTAPCRDLATFRTWAADLKALGFTRLEMSAPWKLLEPRPGEYDLSFIADRVAVARSLRMGVRLRINSYYAGATPGWLECDRWQADDGQAAPGAMPSISDERFWDRYGPLCTAIARRFRGEDVLYSPFIGVHAELKWSEWWSYDPASLALWREAIRPPRPAWLRRVVSDSPLPDRPPVPAATTGSPDVSAVSRAFIAFREERWREAVRRFVHALRAGDPAARVSVPLGESYRRQSAEMSNLDYWGLSRGAEQVVHSYDFFWHAGQPAWYAAAAVAAFRGITGLPVSFEFDGPALFQQYGYKEADLLRIAGEAVGQGAGLKMANYSYADRLPSTWPVLADLAHCLASAGDPGRQAARSKTVLLFVSKWANYSYREPTEWLHDAQFGAWKMLTEGNCPVRFFCEDNLSEDLSGYRGIYVAFSPPELLPEEDRARLARLCRSLPSVVEVACAPAAAPKAELPAGRAPLRDRHAVLGYPLAFCWLRGTDRAGAEAAMRDAVARFRDPGR